MKKRIIWLTGCTSGLGRALVDEFSAAGHTVAGCGRRQELIRDLLNEFPEPHYFEAIDVSSDTATAGFCKHALAVTGPPDLLINNAAIVNEPAPLWQIATGDFDRLIAINISGTANMIRHCVPIMEENGGVIVNLSSGWGRSTSPEVAPYCASKWAIEGLTQALAQELPPGLAAVALNPGIIDTRMLRTCWGDGASHYPDAKQWATTAAPFLLGIGPGNNADSLTAP
ncbi:MAG: SDR family oxidoreductase [Akkermansiaceae bacterium]|nr:SDR family oxidoreductase [Akkermansiaceae bacterium]